jgi:hypothetical protein
MRPERISVAARVEARISLAAKVLSPVVRCSQCAKVRLVVGWGGLGKGEIAKRMERHARV